MNCPYQWANSIDDEDGQCSSWESELEGEWSEELMSLEAPDDEGEWRWPKRNRVAKRVNTMPAFHYLAEETRKNRRLED